VTACDAKSRSGVPILADDNALRMYRWSGVTFLALACDALSEGLSHSLCCTALRGSLSFWFVLHAGRVAPLFRIARRGRVSPLFRIVWCARDSPLFWIARSRRVTPLCGRVSPLFLYRSQRGSLSNLGAERGEGFSLSSGLRCYERVALLE